jgi:hypothetical protein
LLKSTGSDSFSNSDVPMFTATDSDSFTSPVVALLRAIDSYSPSLSTRIPSSYATIFFTSSFNPEILGFFIKPRIDARIVALPLILSSACSVLSDGESGVNPDTSAMLPPASDRSKSLYVGTAI